MKDSNEMTQAQFNSRFEGICQAVVFGGLFLYGIGYELVSYFA